MGDFPMMTERGTFIINGTERIVVSQLVRSPGVYFGITPDKLQPEKDIVDAKMIPGRGAWLEFEVDKKDIVYVRIDRKRKQPVTVLLKALGFGETPRGAPRASSSTRRATPTSRSPTPSRRTTPRTPTPRSSTSTASSARASRPRPTRRAACSRTSSSTPSATTWPRSAGTRCRRSSSTSTPSSTSPSFGLKPRGAGRVDPDEGRHPRHGLVPGEAAQQRPRLLPRRHRPLRQPPGALGRRAHPEPGARGSLAHGAGRARAHDDPGRRGDHPADAHQHPAGRGGDQGVLRLQPAQPVHGPDEPARRAHAQAPPLGARARRAVARACRLRGPRRAPEPLRPHVPDRDAGGPEHRPHRLPLLLRRASTGSASSRRRTARSTDGVATEYDRVPRRRRRGPLRHRPGQRPRSTRTAASSRTRCSCGRGAARSPTSTRTRSTTWTCRRSRSSRWPPR